MQVAGYYDASMVYGMYLIPLPPYDFAYFSGIPGEIAYHGWLFPWTWLLSATLSLIIVGNLFIPIFYKMRLTSVYEVGFLIGFGVLSSIYAFNVN